MANADSTLRNASSDLINATDKLDEAKALAHFIQSISLNVPSDGTITLQPVQLSGFYFAMQNMIDRINEANALIETAMKQAKEHEHA